MLLSEHESSLPKDPQKGTFFFLSLTALKAFFLLPWVQSWEQVSWATAVSMSIRTHFT